MGGQQKGQQKRAARETKTIRGVVFEGWGVLVESAGMYVLFH